MSYYEDDAGDGYMTAEQAYEMGWWSDDDVANLKELAAHLEMADPFPRVGSKNDAAVVLIHAMIDPPADPNDPILVWARTLLGRN